MSAYTALFGEPDPLSPQSAKSRAEALRQRITIAEEIRSHASATGAPLPFEPAFSYRQMLRAELRFAEAQIKLEAERKSANDAIERVSGNFSRASSASRTQGPGSPPTEAPDPSPEEGLRDA